MHVKNRVPSIAAIDLLLQLSSCTRVIILNNMSCCPRKVKLSETPILMRTRFSSSRQIFKKNTTLLSDFDESQVTKRKRAGQTYDLLPQTHSIEYLCLCLYLYDTYMLIYIIFIICMSISFHFLHPFILEKQKQLIPTCPSKHLWDPSFPIGVGLLLQWYHLCRVGSGTLGRCFFVGGRIQDLSRKHTHGNEQVVI